LPHTGVRFKRNAAQNAQDLSAAPSPELEPNSVRDYGGDHTSSGCERRVQTARADKGPGSQQQRD